MADSTFARRYVERKADQEVWDAVCIAARSNTPVHWIALQSQPGNGNSWLLKRLYRKALEDRTLISSLHPILTDGRRPGQPPSPLSPIGTALHLCLNTRLARFHRFRRRVRSAGFKRHGLLVGTIAIAFIAACLVRGFEKYIPSKEQVPSIEDNSVRQRSAV